MTDEDSDSNNCVICLESLATEVLGACTPCGHCFHSACWDSFYSSAIASLSSTTRRGGGGGTRQVKCPTCNGLSTGFCRLYLDLQPIHQHTTNQSDEEDGDATSEYTDNDSDNNNDNGGNDDDTVQQDNIRRRDKSARTSNYVDLTISDRDDDDDQKNLLGHQAPNSNRRRRQPKNKSTSRGEHIAGSRHYERHLKQLQTKIQLLNQQHTQAYQLLQEQYNAVQGNLAQACEDLESATDKCHDFFVQITELNLKIVILQREKKDVIEQQLVPIKRKEAQLRKELNDLRDRYTRDVEKAHANSMIEVQQVLEERPKLKEMIATLQRQLKETQSSLERIKIQKCGGGGGVLQRSTRSDENHKSNTTTNVRNCNPTARTVKMLRSLDNDDDNYDRERFACLGYQSTQTKRTKYDEIGMVSLDRMRGSEHAARMSSGGGRRPLESINPLDVFFRKGSSGT